MTIQDLFDYPLSTRSQPAVEAWSQTARAFLAHGASGSAHLGDALAADADFVIAQAARGLFCLLMARRELVAPAQDALRQAEAAAARIGTTPREAAYVDALSDWLAGRPSAAAARLDATLFDHPADALTLKLVHQIRFMVGDAAGMRQSIERVIGHYGVDHPAAGYVHGCHAFALEETGAYRAAEFAGRRALELAPDDAWGLHAVAHVYDMTGCPDVGLSWLQGRLGAFSHCNNFRFHVWWHKALFHLDLGEIAAVLDLYDAEIRAERTDDFRDIANGASLLARLEIEGVDVGCRWEELAELCAARTDDGSLVFADLHYLMALSAGGRNDGAEMLMSRMQSDATAGVCEMSRVAANPGVALSTALTAFRDGDYRAAHRAFACARPRLQSIGGSHAQRDVFERLAVEAAMRAGLLDDARRLLFERARKRGAIDRFATRRLETIETTLAAMTNSGEVRLQVVI
ncbi:tetratricopeptide repeat protein [Amorphus sp. 3PC139-8]|uniref:tetratricopeptide repeat protein n=1 Tax=Amorphus sp. 3PC139-8 TaxID=2735676 RepID=UPI00345D883F